MPTRFHFDRLFLLYLKKRDAEQPFFVMWVDNAELPAKKKWPSNSMAKRFHIAADKLTLYMVCITRWRVSAVARHFVESEPREPAATP